MGKTTEITFNVTNIRKTGRYPGTTISDETASVVAHEGQHGLDGQFFGPPLNHAESYLTEDNAFTTQSYVDEGLNKTSPYGLWHNGWQENPGTNALRAQSAADNARNEVYPDQKAPGQ